LNCVNCGAPLPARSTICAHCGSRNEVDLRGIHRYTVEVPESARVCPRCDIPMATINVGQGKPFLIEQCPQCSGLFFDPGEVEALLEDSVAHVYDFDLAALETLTRETYRPDPVIYLKCPVCQTLMNRQNFGERSGVVVDRCKAHGVWLDSGEFRRLAEWMKAGGQILTDRIQAERERGIAPPNLAAIKPMFGEGGNGARRHFGILGLIVGAVAERLITMTDESGGDESS